MDLSLEENLTALQTWRTRDVAKDLLDQRGISPFVKEKKTAASASLNVSSQFDIDTCLASVRRDKSAVVRTAFCAAATTVFKAVKEQNGYEQEDDDVCSDADIPVKLLTQLKEIESLRLASFERVNDNTSSNARKGKPSSSSITKNVSIMTSTNGSTNETKTVASENKKSKVAATKRDTAGSKKSAGADIPASPVPPSSSTASSPVDSRSTVSKAVLCVAGSISFDRLSPAYVGHEIDVLDVPQNTSRNTDEIKDEKNNEQDKALASPSTNSPPPVNMGAVLLQSQKLAQRAAQLAENSARRSKQRYEYRRDNALYDEQSNRQSFGVSNPFSWKPKSEGDDEDDEADLIPEPVFPEVEPAEPSRVLTNTWKQDCLPRLASVLDKGSGHAVYCDLDWATRYGRIADLFHNRMKSSDNLGPHLIITTQPNVDRFAKEFESHNSYMCFNSSTTTTKLRVLAYKGKKSERRELRQHFSKSTGLPTARFHVLVTSYTVFLQDYLHLCQLPYQVAILDEGLSWLSAAHADPNCTIGLLWENGVWSKSDQHVGLAGTFHEEWDFNQKRLVSKESVRNACIGLTARNRIITAASLHMKHKETKHLTPSVFGLISFFMPHFAETVREEWDRSRIATDAASMEHFRKLLTRSVVVHHPNGDNNDLFGIALGAMNGSIPASQAEIVDPTVPVVVNDEKFVSSGKVSQSRRFALAWFGSPQSSWIRYELGADSFQVVLDAMKLSSSHGHVCEEVVTRSSTTSSGAGGAVTGTHAYRLAVRCGRNFGSEQGLRQHMAALHAPPGTWLCRTCGGDCGTSQARTHHERTCGQPAPGAQSNQGNAAPGGVSTVGQGVGSAGKKGSASRASRKTSTTGSVQTEEKDADGSFRVPGYRGVWVNPSGKHFVKIGGTPLLDEKDGVSADEKLLFDTVEEAARKHDDHITAAGDESSPELNFRSDGSRIVYEDNTAAAAAGRGLEMLGAGASSVVPALSVINIKDLPKDVKPLLRDPRQTSRTGGNSKRHVYAYRGVCRQARKGHDRWQSQISFGGTNHYLGTFDSEWDAAAIYAWAHLILYGEEATKKAQKEGEEAAAAYEQEKKDIAAGKIVAPPPKQPKKPKQKRVKGAKKSTEEKIESSKDKIGNADATDGTSTESKKPHKKRQLKGQGENSPLEKQPRTGPRGPGKGDNLSIAPFIARGVLKAHVLSPRESLKDFSDGDIAKLVSQRILASRSVYKPMPAVSRKIRTCVPTLLPTTETPPGTAMLLGLSATLFSFDVDAFVSSCNLMNEAERVTSALQDEYRISGYNETFRTVLQGSFCVIGRASQNMEKASRSLRLGDIQLGGTSGEMDCNIGGIMGSCSEAAAVISLTRGGDDFKLCACNDTDVVTLNGHRIKPDMGNFPLLSEDICTVGARVFIFVLPS